MTVTGQSLPLLVMVRECAAPVALKDDASRGVEGERRGRVVWIGDFAEIGQSGAIACRSTHKRSGPLHRPP